jgi:subtilisin family serine protease
LRGALPALFAVALLCAPAASAAERHGYIVQLKVAPVSSYTGGTKGIPATSPLATGKRVSRSDAAVKEYRSFLADRQAALLAKVGSPKPTYSYRMAFAGFAADLTAEEADTLKHSPQVARVWRDALAQPQTNPTPDDLLGGHNGDGAAYLGLTTGLWPQLGGPNHAGEGVIVGDIDTGITPEHPSFADRPGPNHLYRGPAYDPPEVWDGACQGGEDFPTSSCNNKLIGARYYVAGFGADRVDPSGFLSPRDDDGHGSHTASTAAGNFGVDPSIAGNDLGVDEISGIAPRAYIAAYKVCWESDVAPAGCSNADSVAAIDDAVADGVDVINYSIGSSSSSLIDPVAIAFLGATDAGVFVASSAGNDGPGAGTVGSPNSVPWLTSVAASSLARTFQADATINSPGSDPLTVHGASVTNALDESPIVDAATSGTAGTDPADAELCEPDSLDPAKVDGAVVLCKRGDNARIDKSRNVQLAGGVGMILYNVSDAQELVTDTHWVPSVHISFSDGVAVKNLIKPGATAELTAGTATPFNPGGVLAAFSSRGPQTAVPDIAKPDVAAPGVNILAAASPRPADSTELVPGELFQSISGTSMASPHVAGSAALLTQLHPLFTPAEIKSSLMTTANPEKVLKEDGVTPAGPFDRGSGEIDPNKAADPGLVLDVTTDDYLGYLSGQDPTLFAGTPPDPIAATDLNLPSISNSQVPGRLTTTRTFTGVTQVAKRWDVAVNVDGWTATASPRSFTLKPGAQQTVTFTFTKASATPLNAYRFGEAALVSGTSTVRLPVSLKAIALKAPSPVTASTTAASGSKQFTVQSGFAGPLTAQGFGLAAPVLHAGEHVSATSGNPNLSGTDPGTDLFPVTVPAGSQLFATRISNVDGGDPNTDLDLFVYRQNPNGSFSLVGASAGGTALEHVELTFPTAGNYLIAVVGFTTADPDSVYDLTHWVATDPTADNLTPPPPAGMSVTGDPVNAAIGQTVPLTLNWAGVDAPGTYMGVITYHNGATPSDANRVGLSLVEITRSGAAATSVTSDDAGGATTSAPDRFGVLGATSAFGLKVKSAKVQGRTLVLRLRTAGHPALRVSVKHGSRTVAKGAVAAVRSGTRTVKVRLSHRLQRGTRYSVRVTAVASGNRLARTLRLKVH